MSRRTRILVVDDNPDMLHVFSGLLRESGYEVLEAASGEQCLNIVSAQRPDLVLLDVVLPGIGGFEVCKAIKSDPALARIFVVLISGQVTATENKIDGLNAGADEYLARPIMMAELLARVEAMVRIQKSEAALCETQEHLETRIAERTAELYASEKRFRTFFETAPEVVFSLDADGTIASLNPAFETLTGWPRAEWLRKPCADLIHPQDLALAVEKMRRILQEKKARDIELRVRASTGDFLVGEFTVAPLIEHDEATGVFGFARDITGRKRSEALLRGLSRRLLEAQEGERRRVARELHDSVGQLLASARFRVQAIEKDLRDENLLGEAVKARRLLDCAIHEVRRISHNLRPSELDDLGLVPTIRSACEDFRERNGVALDLKFSRLPKRLSRHIDLTLYRIVQEALNNIEKHARATRVTLDLKREGSFILLTVADNGRGFDPLATRTSHRKKTGLGLVNMRERAGFAGGTFHVEAAPKKGTAITVRVPLNISDDEQ